MNVDRDNFRLSKVNKLVQKNISKILHTEIKDPRLQFVDVLEVEITSDFALARVYYTLFNTHDVDENSTSNQIKDLEKVFKKASGFIRTKIAKSLQFRKTPEIRFIYDLRYKNATQVDNLLKNIENNDNITSLEK